MTTNTESNPLLRLAAPVLGLLAACSSTPTGPAGTPETPDSPAAGIALATVDGVELTLEDALETFVSSHLGHGVLVRGEPAVRELAGRIAERRLFLAEAETLGLPEDPELRQVVDEHRLQLAKQRFWKDEVDARAQVSDEQVEAFYEKTGVALDLGLIEVEERAQAEELRAQVQAGADLTELADRFSLHSSRSFGGTMSLVLRGQLEPAQEEAAFALQQPGELSQVVPSAKGFTFLRLEQRVENTSRPEREVMLPQIRKALEAKRQDDLRTQVTERLREQAGATTRAEILTRERILAQDDGQEVAAAVGDEALTVEGLRTVLDLGLVEKSEAAVLADAMQALVDDWVLDQVLRREVEARGLLADPEIDSATRTFEKNTVYRLLLERYVYAGIDPSEEDLERCYQERVAESYSQQPELHMAYLVLKTEDEARQALQRLEAGEEFGAVAGEVSLDQRSSVHGGRIGWVQAKALLPEVEQALLDAKDDSLQGPIETGVGWFVVHVLERREGYPFPFQQVRHVVHRDLIKQLRQQRLDQWKQRLAERADLQIHEDGVRAAVAWLDEQAAEQESEAPQTPSSHGRPGLPEAVTTGASSGGLTPSTIDKGGVR